MASLPTETPELIARLRDPKRCREAFGEVIRLYTEPLYRQIRRLVQDHDDANDLLQNTFIKAWNNLNNFRGDAKLSTWLYKIAVNESINFLNKERKAQTTTLPDGDENADNFLIRNLQADEYFDGNELQLELQKAIATLPEKQRLVFNMRYFDDMKYERISEILGTSVGALKANYHHAVKKIAEYISNLEK